MSALPMKNNPMAPDYGGYFTDALQTAGGYALGQSGIDKAQALGQEGYDKSLALAEDAYGKAEFVPYTVKTGLGTTATDAAGGIDLMLSPEAQAIQDQMFGTGTGMLGAMGQPIDQATADIYGQMRAVQMPEEERARLALEERMLSQGRMGLGSAAYGGSNPEMLAQAQAEHQARLQTNLLARTQALTEQKQQYDIGSGMLEMGYTPESRALDALTAGTDVASLAEHGRTSGANLYGQLGATGVESYMGGAELANRLELQQQDALMNTMFGGGDDGTSSGSIGGGLVDDVVDYAKDWATGYLAENVQGTIGGYEVRNNVVEGLGYWTNTGEWVGKDPELMTTSEHIARQAANPHGRDRG